MEEDETTGTGFEELYPAGGDGIDIDNVTEEDTRVRERLPNEIMVDSGYGQSPETRRIERPRRETRRPARLRDFV